MIDNRRPFAAGARALLAIFATLVALTATSPAGELERIRVSTDAKGFVGAKSGKSFVPWGVNYDHDERGRLIEDYWNAEWAKVDEDFGEIKQLGANLVRVHVQFAKFMEAADKPRAASLERLAKLLSLAEKHGLYLDITGLGCYHKADVPAWYDALDEAGRWKAQAVFWESVAKTCSTSRAVFCYDLMNEPVVAAGNAQKDWLGPPFGDKHFVQYITRDRGERDRADIARAWTKQLVAAIRRHDREALVTVGLVPWSLDRPGLSSGFVPEKVVAEIDFVAVHVYPEKGKVVDAVATVKAFSVGKPVVIEETFALSCSVDEWEQFVAESRPHAAGYVGFYWGKTLEECRKSKSIPDAMMAALLAKFSALAPAKRRGVAAER